MDRALRHVRAASLAFMVLALLAAGVLVRSGAVAATRQGDPVMPASSAAIGFVQEPMRPPQEIRLIARKYSFSPSRIEVQENDLVKVTLETADIPHSFTIDDDNYRIAKRATPGHPVVFEFRADKAGTFPFYCNLTTDSGCKNMRGELVVSPKR